MEKGIKIRGINANVLLQSLYHTGAIAASVKDPVWKYHWVKENEPEIFERIYKWLDVKEALIYKMTNEAVMSEDSAFATLLYDIRSKEMVFSKKIMELLEVNPQHLPRIIASTDLAGKLTAKAAKELGLKEGIDVYAGGGDSALTPIGAGMLRPRDSHIYMGTSGWASVITDKRHIDISAMIASIVGGIPGLYNYFAELETAGKCLEWVKDHLVLDEINVYLDQKDITESKESIYLSLYDYLSEVIDIANPGSDGVIFAPWLHGNRCPFEDPNARAMFFNISLETGKTELLRAVVEGVCFHFRWFLETMEKKVVTSERIRFVGGGALSSVTCQILSDILGREVQTVKDPQNVGAVGAALIAYLGRNPEVDLIRIMDKVPLGKVYSPNLSNKAVYEKNFQVFKELYGANKKFYAKLQGEL